MTCTHVVVKSYDDESNERVVKRFLKKCKKENLHALFMERYPGSARYSKKSVRIRQEKNLHNWRHQKRIEEEKAKDDALG